LLLAMFAGAALLLAGVGIYGVLSYAVSQQTREIGLRMALGATGRRTIGLVVRNSVVMLATGVGVGLGLSLALARSMSQILYAVSPFDLLAFSIASTLLIATGLVATLLPARRATRVDPMVALRSE
jgi:ABC-type antimicrobial peptide transport system permease subunit